MRTPFVRVNEANDKATALLDAIRDSSAITRRTRFDVDPDAFRAIPGAPFAYWVDDLFRSIFRSFAPLEGDGREAKLGMSTWDDFRFVRAATEINLSSNTTWSAFAKGGAFSRYYSDLYLAIDYDQEAKELRALGAPIRNPSMFFKSGLTWPRRTQGGFSVRAMPAGAIFGDKGPGIFIKSNSNNQLLSLLAIANCQCFFRLVVAQMAFGSYEVGVIQRTPVPRVDQGDETVLATLAYSAWSLKRSLDTITETSHAFHLPALLQVAGPDLATRAAAWGDRVQATLAELDRIQAEIDDRCFALYGIDDADRTAITAGFGVATGDDGGGGADADDGDDEVAEAPGADPATLAADLVSWAVGVAFGRFDVRLATGERPAPPEPGPFDALPQCSPAMLVGDDGLPLASPPPGYAIDFPEDGILVDDPGHPRDLVAAVGRVFDVVFGAAADAWLQEVVRVLDPRAADLRPWLANRFFDHHLKRHSMSRRKAPILWPIASPKGRYRVWVAAHRATADTLHQIEATIVKPRLDAATRLLEAAHAEARANPGPAARSALAAREEMEAEVRTLHTEVLRVAPFWKPDLDDGVVLAAAPLWRLVPVHRAWQRELKGKWDALAKGTYDWAHLAMHLWPERALRRCAADRSVAIAHDVEAEFWQEVRPDTWVARAADPDRDRRLLLARFSENRNQAVTAFINAPGG